MLTLEDKPIDALLAQIARDEEVHRQYLTQLLADRSHMHASQRNPLRSLAADSAIAQATAHLEWLRHCVRVLTEQGTASADSPLDPDRRIDRCAEDTPTTLDDSIGSSGNAANLAPSGRGSRRLAKTAATSPAVSDGESTTHKRNWSPSRAQNR